MFSRLVCRCPIKKNTTNMYKIIRYNSNIKYTETHEWILNERDCTKVGLSNTAIEQLGELVYLDFISNKGDIIKKNEELVAIESVKAVDSINAPYDCVVLGVNTNLEDPEYLINLSNNPECTDSNWIIKIDEIP